MPSTASNMPTLFPTQNCLKEVFVNQSPFPRPAPQCRSSDHPLKRPIFSALSVAETAQSAKAKAGQLKDAAVDKYEKASAKAQAKTGNIELYSGKYYAACTVGGILACVSGLKQYQCREYLTSTRVRPIPQSHRSISSNAVDRSTPTSTRATCRPGV